MIANNKKAFTMLEMTFVIVVLGILAAVAIPKFTATRDDAIEARVKKQITAIRTSIENERQAHLQSVGGMENSGNGTLTLYYDYQPWKGENYTNGKSAVIMQDVDTFRFRTVGDLIKVQLCVKDSNISRDGGYSICKEKTVF
ncbi:type II secretion system protein [Sulfurimonas sp. HSL-1716]|uniref:type II secretion system protein n=1 Tax=Hydrocurvibacter sulfurireducens TaxID=3131937 RepID=UPI0031F7ED4D